MIDDRELTRLRDIEHSAKTMLTALDAVDAQRETFHSDTGPQMTGDYKGHAIHGYVLERAAEATRETLRKLLAVTATATATYNQDPSHAFRIGMRVKLLNFPGEGNIEQLTSHKAYVKWDTNASRFSSWKNLRVLVAVQPTTEGSDGR